jgi:hypothetical protein
MPATLRKIICATESRYHWTLPAALLVRLICRPLSLRANRLIGWFPGLKPWLVKRDALLTARGPMGVSKPSRFTPARKRQADTLLKNLGKMSKLQSRVETLAEPWAESSIPFGAQTGSLSYIALRSEERS